MPLRPSEIAATSPFLPEFQKQHIGAAESYFDESAAQRDYPHGTRGAIYSMNDMSRMSGGGIDTSNAYWEVLRERYALPMSFEMAPPPPVNGKLPIPSILTPEDKSLPGDIEGRNSLEMLHFNPSNPFKFHLKSVSSTKALPVGDDMFYWKDCAKSNVNDQVGNTCHCGTAVRYGKPNDWIGGIRVSDTSPDPTVKCAAETFDVKEKQGAKCQCASHIWKLCAHKGDLCHCTTTLREGLSANAPTSVVNGATVCNAPDCYCAVELNQRPTLLG